MNYDDPTISVERLSYLADKDYLLGFVRIPAGAPLITADRAVKRLRPLPDVTGVQERDSLPQWLTVPLTIPEMGDMGYMTLSALVRRAGIAVANYLDARLALDCSARTEMKTLTNPMAARERLLPFATLDDDGEADE